jgi:hypothetical protein
MTSSNTDFAIIGLLTEYIPKKKVVYTETVHAMNKSYTCANPRGPISNIGCPDDDPLCNCPCKELRPYTSEVVTLQFCKENYLLFSPGDIERIFIADTENPDQFAIIKSVFDEQTNSDSAPTIYKLVELFDTEAQARIALRNAIKDSSGPSGGSGGIEYDEPSDSYLDNLISNSSECSLIEQLLGSEWLGCDLEDPQSPFSCNCPCIGEMYSYYLRFNKTVATFWDTPGYVPLISLAHKAALISQQIAISIMGDITIRPGDLIELDLLEPTPFEQELDKIVRKYGIFANVSSQYMKYTGYWMVSTIKHVISGNTNHKMDLILIRDGVRTLEE